MSPPQPILLLGEIGKRACFAGPAGGWSRFTNAVAFSSRGKDCVANLKMCNMDLRTPGREWFAYQSQGIEWTRAGMMQANCCISWTESTSELSNGEAGSEKRVCRSKARCKMRRVWRQTTNRYALLTRARIAVDSRQGSLPASATKWALGLF